MRRARSLLWLAGVFRRLALWATSAERFVWSAGVRAAVDTGNESVLFIAKATE